MERKAVFLKGLSEHLKDELAAREVPDELTSFVALAIKIDNRLRERQRERTTRSSRPSPPAKPVPLRSTSAETQLDQPPVRPAEDEPMQLGRAKLTPEERLRRIRAGECLYCGQRGHFVSNCPARPKGGARQ